MNTFQVEVVESKNKRNINITNETGTQVPGTHFFGGGLCHTCMSNVILSLFRLIHFAKSEMYT